MSSLAKRYNISDVGLAKVCRKLQIPVPPRGYWAKVRNGYKITRPPLPKLLPKQLASATISPLFPVAREIPEEVQKQQAFEAAPENRISEAYFSRKLHPLVQTTKQIVTGKLGASREVAPLNLRVSKNSRERALHLLSALFYACEERGYSVTADKDKGALLIVQEESITFSLEEPSRRITIPESKRKNSWDPRFELEPTGKLTLRVQEWADNVRRSWSDGAKQKLEDKLNDVMCDLVEISLALRKQRLERERQQAIWQEQARQRALYEERKRQLETDIKQLNEATRLRDFAEQIMKRLGTEDDQMLLQSWCDWVLRVAASFDPTSDGAAVFVNRYKMEER